MIVQINIARNAWMETEIAKKCEDGKLEKNEYLEKKINERYKVICNQCFLTVIPNQFNHHLETACQSSTCVGQSFEKICGKKDEKIKILYHQIFDCDLVDNLKTIEYPLYSRLIYLLIGVGIYQDENMQNLQAPPNDVEEMESCLEKIGFEKNEKRILLNENACKSNIEYHLNQLKEEMEGNSKEEHLINSHSMIIFYYSGHGMLIQSQKDLYQICPHDFQIRSNENGMNVQELIEFLYGINCKHVLLVLDSCYVGGIFRSNHLFSINFIE